MKKLLSFIIPCYGSEKTVSFVIDEICKTVKERSHEYDYEIIAVNDCSPDDVWGVLLNLSDSNKKIKLVGLAKNMNRPGAVMAGLRMSSGDIAIILDDDGQCPMDHLWDLIAPIETGYDVSTAAYPKRKQSAFKDFGTYVNKKMTQFILNRPKGLEFTNFLAMRRYIVEEVCRYNNPYPYMTGLLLRTTHRITSVPMEERSRISGRSTFTFKKMMGMWMNGLTAFSIKPLRLASLLGMITALAGFVFAAFIVIRKLVDPEIAVGYSSIMAVILLIGGVLMLLLGMVGEYLGRVYISINSSPQYVIRDVVNFDEGKEQ